MERIRDELVFERVIVWDNSVRPDWKTAGRYFAAGLAGEWVYFQDDDCLVPAATQEALVAAAGDPECVANWGHGETPDGYDDLPLVCGGAVVWAEAAWRAIFLYASRYPLDDAFAYEADFVVGALYRSFRHVRLPFEIELGIAQAPERLCNQPWQRDLKREITDRARGLRSVEVAA